MRIEFYKSLWGFESLPLPTFLERVQEAGWDGVESPMVIDTQAIHDQGLNYIAQGFPDTIDGLKRDIECAVRRKAILLNLQVGRESWAFETACGFLEQALPATLDAPLPVAFETHRGRLFYSAATSARLIERFPEVRLTADFSHWTCVSESLLEDQDESVSLAIEKVIYLHARVGHEQGPQISDPEDSRWGTQVRAFESWWLRIADAHLRRGEEVLRIDPEFGPPNYMPTNHDDWMSALWRNCSWVKDRLETALET